MICISEEHSIVDQKRMTAKTENGADYPLKQNLYKNTCQNKHKSVNWSSVTIFLLILQFAILAIMI